MPRWEGSCEKPHRRRCLLSEFFKKKSKQPQDPDPYQQLSLPLRATL